MKCKFKIISFIIILIFSSCKNENKLINSYTYDIDTVFFQSGEIKRVTKYRNDKKHGKELTYLKDGTVKEYFYYIDGIKEGKAYIRDFKTKTINECVFNDGYKSINGIHMNDDMGRKLIRYYNFYAEDTAFVGELYFQDFDDKPDSYYYAGELYDTIKQGETYEIKIKTYKHELEKESLVTLWLISNGETILTIDTSMTEEILKIPIPKYNLDINKIIGYIDYVTDTIEVNGVKKRNVREMLFYKWLVVEPPASESL